MSIFKHNASFFKTATNSLLAVCVFAGLFIGVAHTAIAQTSAPVQVNSQLVPPNSIYLSDYAAAGLNKWPITLTLRDFTKTDYHVRLRITIQSQTISLRTKASFRPVGMYLEPGMPTQVSADVLAAYLNPNNLDISGDVNQFGASQQLPEGFYTFNVEVLDYQRGNVVSNMSRSMAWIVQNEPPLLNLPYDNKLRIQDPQQIQFQWTPRHTSSPNSAFETEYIFKLWQIRPEGRNPNEVVRTSAPIFEHITNLNSYFYSVVDEPLNPGWSYAWQVQAVSNIGRDLFRNDGKSEVKSFQYGDECMPVSGVGLEALGPDRIRVSWTAEWNHSGFVVKAREQGTAEWTNFATNLEMQVVFDLTAGTAYEVQVIPSCGVLNGAGSDIMVVSTLEQSESDFECGADPDNPAIENREPIAQLSVGDRIEVMGFKVRITEINGAGPYNGMGIIEVPLFQLAGVEAELVNIEVNTDKKLIGGYVETTLNPDGPFIMGLDSDPQLSEDGLDADGNPIETPPTDVDVDGVVDEITVDTETGVITVTTEDGETTTIDPTADGTDKDGDGNIVVEDSNGDTWVVGPDGTVKQGGNTGGPSNPSALPADATIDFIVNFEANQEQSYGFDTKQLESLASFYGQTQIRGDAYTLSWKSVASGQPDKVVAKQSAGDSFNSAIAFKTITGNLPITASTEDLAKNVTVQGTTHQDEFKVQAFVLQEQENEAGETTEEEIILGELNVVSYDKVAQKVIIVPVNTASAPAASTISTALNNIYGQAVAEWEVVVANQYETNIDLSGAGDEEKSNLSNYPPRLKDLFKAYKGDNSIDRDAYYVFLMPNGSSASKAGYMPFKKQWGFIYPENASDISTTIAHELGHGTFRLRHTFSSEANYAAQGTTNNLMDYNNGTKLYKHQWDLVHDPENVTTLFEDESESEMTWTFYSEKYTSLFNHIYDNNNVSDNTYWTKINSSSDEVVDIDYNGEFTDWVADWKIRNYTKEEVFNNVTKAIKEADNQQEIGEIVLRPKHIYLGKCEYDGQEYPYAIYRDFDGDMSNVKSSDYTLKSIFTKIQVSKLEDLSNSESMNHIYSDETFSKYLIIGLVEEGKKKPTVVIQIEKFLGDATLEKWLEYLEIYKPEPSIFYSLKETTNEVGKEFIINTGIKLRDLTDYFSTQSISEIESKIELYNNVNNNFEEYLERAKNEDFNIEGHTTWSIRQSSFSVRNNLTLIERVVNNLLDGNSSFNLHNKGVFMGNYELDGVGYNIAVYSEVENINTTRVRVSSLSELSGESKIKVGVNDEYVLIAFFDDESKLQFIIQIDNGNIETAKKWLKYLGILVEDETYLESVIIPYWEEFFGTDKYEEVTLSNVNWVSQFDAVIAPGCSQGCCYYTSNYILNQTSGKNALYKENVNDIAVFSLENNYSLLSPTGNFETRLLYLEKQIVENGSPVVVGVHYNKNVTPYNHNPATYHFVVIVGKGYDSNKKSNYFLFYEVGTGPEHEITRGKHENNRLYVDKESRFISGSRGYDTRFYTITEIRTSE